MTLSYQDDWLTIYGGDCRTVLAELPDESVHCVVTSPPYWGLRDYGTATWEGGEDGCDHSTPRSRGDDIRAGDKQGTSAGSRPNTTQRCRCGAVRIDSQLGLEPTPEQYVENMVAVFREVRRVLRSDGTVWLNLGDSYAANGVSGLGTKGESSTLVGTANAAHTAQRKEVPSGLKPKDLVGIPWRVAFALQADGWYLRSDIIWSKPNPMPESVTDRPTKSHEYLFLLAKSPRYYFDADAVRETDNGRPSGNGFVRPARLTYQNGDGTPRGNPDEWTPGGGRNIRTVWTVATQPYPGAHFAVFPEKLIEPCILAGTSERGVCPECGKPWRRVTETERVPLQNVYNGAVKTNEQMTPEGVRWGGSGVPSRLDVRTLSWIPSCAHGAAREEHDRQASAGTHLYEDDCPFCETPATVGAVVLDPFGGSGTTARVANRLSRRAVLIDLNPEYLRQQMDRNRDIPLGLGA